MKRIYIPIFMLLLMSFCVSAQQKGYKGVIKITPRQFEQKGDSLYVSVDIDVRDIKVNTRRSINLVPILTATGKEQVLPEVVVKGRADYLCMKRRLALMSKEEREQYEQKPPYVLVRGYKKNEIKEIRYNKIIPFEPWMKGACLDLREEGCGCGNPPRLLGTTRLVDRVKQEPIVVPYTVMPMLAYIQPAVEAIKKRELVGEAFLDFVVSKTDIRPDYMNNPRELKKITDMMSEARNDSSVTVRSISVIGYASPEGSLSFNQKLSEGRAKALVDYLTPLFDYPKGMYRVVFGGENWSGLLKVVESSDIAYRDEVIHVLKNVPAEINYKTNISRKKVLMSLRGGAPYRYMLKAYFPQLRKALCKLDYEVKSFDIAEARKVLRTRPQNLSLNEMYLVANTYELGSPEFTDIFETAVRMFPEDETANLNAAAAVLARRDTVAAARYLKKVKHSGAEYNNTMGVLMLLKENYTEAEKHLLLAAQSGLESAKRNLDELKKKQNNIKLLNKSHNSINK